MEPFNHLEGELEAATLAKGDKGLDILGALKGFAYTFIKGRISGGADDLDLSDCALRRYGEFGDGGRVFSWAVRRFVPVAVNAFTKRGNEAIENVRTWRC